jgi:hypothetical protein
MQGVFSYYNIHFDRKGGGIWVFAKGEITNNSNKDYNTAMFRLNLFEKKKILWSETFKIRGFRRRQTRPFELLLENLDYKAMSAISRYDIYFEGGY